MSRLCCLSPVLGLYTCCSAALVCMDAILSCHSCIWLAELNARCSSFPYTQKLSIATGVPSTASTSAVACRTQVHWPSPLHLTRQLPANITSVTPVQARIQGFGSSSGADPLSPTSPASGPSASSTANNANWAASSKMVGFGNPRFEAASRPPPGKAQSYGQAIMSSKNWASAASATASAASTLASKGQTALGLKGIHSLIKDEVRLLHARPMLLPCWAMT